MLRKLFGFVVWVLLSLQSFVICHFAIAPIQNTQRNYQNSTLLFKKSMGCRPSCVVCPIICCLGKGLFLTLWLAQGVVVSQIDKSFRGVVTMVIICFWRCSSLNVEKVFSALNDRLLEPVTEVQLVSWILLQIHILIHWSIFGIYWSYQKKRLPQIKPVPDVQYAQTFGAINLLHYGRKCYCSSVNKGL